MHELGHNLLLSHQGNDLFYVNSEETPYACDPTEFIYPTPPEKYPMCFGDIYGNMSTIHASVMNYRYQFSGVRIEGDRFRHIYSYGENGCKEPEDSPKYACRVDKQDGKIDNPKCDCDFDEWRKKIVNMGRALDYRSEEDFFRDYLDGVLEGNPSNALEASIGYYFTPKKYKEVVPAVYQIRGFFTQKIQDYLVSKYVGELAAQGLESGVHYSIVQSGDGMKNIIINEKRAQ
ncbi:MAG: hypothetical protein Kow0090_05010 [Myxococcota bacterium]